jgi:hypothetical protein
MVALFTLPVLQLQLKTVFFLLFGLRFTINDDFLKIMNLTEIAFWKKAPHLFCFLCSTGER